MLTPEKLLAIAIVEEEALAAGTTTSWCAERRIKDALVCAEMLEQSDRTTLRWVGPFGNEPSIQKGDKVRVRKGAPIRTLRSNNVVYSGGERPGQRARKSYTITVHRVGNGWVERPTNRAPIVRNPTIIWAGAGGYWCEVDINDVEKVS